ncbi:MAG: TetR/AcrR family transcriptional regulator C-terminal domain-containing protein [Alphaproteobacteria bacterium]|nr:TetR/AcrR family transcriptional regulator C-terminal domain-containing protein [Alphaproteobacteria bacterium]
MREKREYRSAIRSRKAIRQAFLELLKEKTFEKITVTDIVKRADINRSTFYAHYPDVMGLIEEIQNEVLDYTYKMLKEMSFQNFFENPKPLLKEIVKMAEENNELYRLLSNSNIGVRQLVTIKEILIERTIKTMEIPGLASNSLEKEFAVRFFMGGVVDIYLQWLNGKLNGSIDELTDELAKLLIRMSKDYI